MARLPEEVEVEPVIVAGPPGNERLQAEWIRPRQAAGEAVILYTIGGGYVSGSCNDHRAMVAKIAKGSGVSILLFEHRLAPEHPFPPRSRIPWQPTAGCWTREFPLLAS